MQKLYQGLGHIAIHTRDMDGSIAFYEKIGGSLLPPGDDFHTGWGKAAGTGVLCRLFAGADPSPRCPVPMGEGNIPHFAVYVDDVDAAAAALRSAGVDTFLKPEKTVLPNLFGGLENRFFTVPPGSRSSFCTCSDIRPKRDRAYPSGYARFLCLIAGETVSRRAAVPAR